MPLFIAEHKHAGERCPANNSQMAKGLLQLVDEANAESHGITINGHAVANGQHHLYLIVEAPSEQEVKKYFAPFGQVGTLKVTAASHCKQVVGRGHC
jgi:hypothetical protein